jgi:hypothetical protein
VLPLFPARARFAPALDSLPPEPPVTAAVYAPGDIYPRGPRERELCAEASRPDWLYLGGLLALDVGAIALGSSQAIKYLAGSSPGDVAVRLSGPAAIGLTWGATVGGAWLSLPACSASWVGETPREGAVRATWPIALSLALLAAATAPIVNAIAVGGCTVDQVQPPGSVPWCQGGLPAEWTTLEREMHVVTAAIAGFGGALLPYVIPPRTWAAARELDRIRFGAQARGAYVGYAVAF